MYAGRHLERLEEIMREVCADFEYQIRGPAPPLLAGEPSVVRLLLRQVVGGALPTALRHYIEQQNQPA